MTPYTTPTLDENPLTQTIARQITNATHASLDRTDAPTLGFWKAGSSDDHDWRPAEGDPGTRPVGWVAVNTRKRGRVVVWCEGWTKVNGRYLASISWPTEYTSLTDADLAARLEIETDNRDNDRNSLDHTRRTRSYGAAREVARIVDEQRRRIVERIIRAGSAQPA